MGDLAAEGTGWVRVTIAVDPRSDPASPEVAAAILWGAEGYSGTEIGLLFSVGVAAEIAFFIFSARLLRRFSLWALIVFGSSVAVFRWIVFPHASGFSGYVALQCLHALAARTEAVLDEGRSLAAEVRDIRLGLEVAVIQTFADKIVALLKERDPLSETVHLKPLQLLGHSVAGITAEMLRRTARRRPVSNPAAGA